MEGNCGLMATPAPIQSDFPRVMAAAVGVSALIALVDRYDRRAAGIFTLTLLLGVVLARDVTTKATELIDAISGVQTTGKTVK